MSLVRSKNTGPEIAVRRALHRLGARFRLHRKDLPGSPDIVLPKWRSVVFVHGCFWHGHVGCARARMPKSNNGYWTDKIARNQSRDAAALEALAAAGWAAHVIWECETKNAAALSARLAALFDRNGGR